MLLVMMSPEIAFEHLKNGPKNCLYVSDKEEAAKLAAHTHILDGSLPYEQRLALLDAYSRFMWCQGRDDNMEHDESV